MTILDVLCFAFTDLGLRTDRNVKDLEDLLAARANEDDFDALMFPGGYGAAKNLCDFATAGADAQVERSVKALVTGALKARKPICAVCIAPAMLSARTKSFVFRRSE